MRRAVIYISTLASDAATVAIAMGINSSLASRRLIRERSVELETQFDKSLSEVSRVVRSDIILS